MKLCDVVGSFDSRLLFLGDLLPYRMERGLY